jgi:hypothetical protein
VRDGRPVVQCRGPPGAGCPLMASAFEREAIMGLIEQAEQLGVDVPDEVLDICMSPPMPHGGMLWVKAHPDRAEEGNGCCAGDAIQGPEYCTCWEPVYEAVQARPVPDPDGVVARDGLCGDCAFRPGSPERAEDYTRETLFRLADTGRPFYCHDGMRRPVLYRHPDGREVAGDTADWQPPIVDGIPYRLDGRPGMLCAGWAARAGRKRPRPDVIS